MTIRELTALTIKISGLVLLVLVAAKLPEYFKSYLEQKELFPIWGYVVPLLIPAIIAIVLITAPFKVSDSVILGATRLSHKGDLAQLEVIAIRVLGLLLLFWATSDLVYHVSNHLMMSSADPGFPGYVYNYPYLIATVVELVFALWLLFGTNGVLALLRQVRR